MRQSSQVQSVRLIKERFATLSHNYQAHAHAKESLKEDLHAQKRLIQRMMECLDENDAVLDSDGRNLEEVGAQVHSWENEQLLQEVSLIVSYVDHT